MPQQKHYTAPVSEINRKDCETLVRLALEEDAPSGDSTSESIFNKTDTGSARVIARESGVLCGIPVIEILLEIYFEMTGQTVMLRPHFRDGLLFQKGDTLFTLEGSLISLFRLERILLNFVQYLSGISTVTAKAVETAPENLVILDTRKTLPGYRKLVKYAVFCGGGSNHRISLSDMAMIKDNHIASIKSIQNAIKSIRIENPGIPVEVEVDTLQQLESVLNYKIDAVLLDNMDGDTLKKAIDMIRKQQNPPFIEISGNITPEKFSELKDLGQIGVSMGYLTHTTRFLDLSMELTRNK